MVSSSVSGEATLPVQTARLAPWLSLLAGGVKRGVIAWPRRFALAPPGTAGVSAGNTFAPATAVRSSTEGAGVQSPVDLLEGQRSASPTRGRQISTRHPPDKPIRGRGEALMHPRAESIQPEESPAARAVSGSSVTDKTKRSDLSSGVRTATNPHVDEHAKLA